MLPTDKETLRQQAELIDLLRIRNQQLQEEVNIYKQAYETQSKRIDELIERVHELENLINKNLGM